MFTITWSANGFEKSWKAGAMDAAILIAKNPAYWPIEIADYSEMITTISEGDTETVFTYEELKAA